MQKSLKTVLKSMKIMKTDTFKEYVKVKSDTSNSVEFFEILSIDAHEQGLLVNYRSGWYGYPEHDDISSVVLDFQDWNNILDKLENIKSEEV